MNCLAWTFDSAESLGALKKKKELFRNCDIAPQTLYATSVPAQKFIFEYYYA